MKDPTDNVSRLERIAKTMEAGHWLSSAKVVREAADEIERLRVERDEARRRVCEMSLQIGKAFRRVDGKTVEVTTPEGCAEIMRWDCFKENAND